MEAFLTPEALISLLTLTALEIVLGIDNIIFISILTGRLPAESREKARKVGVTLALLMRLALLGVIGWIAQLTTPLFSVAGVDFSGKSLILLAGGLFLLFKATRELHDKLEGEEHGDIKAAAASFGSVIFQILLLDLVFSIDSVITAVGMAPAISIMVVANVVAVVVMLLSGKAIGDFVHRHPTFKVLALSFLMMIGVLLVAEGLGFHIPKGYIYFAMGFSVAVEFVNLRVRKPAAPVQLHNQPTIKG